MSLSRITFGRGLRLSTRRLEGREETGVVLHRLIGFADTAEVLRELLRLEGADQAGVGAPKVTLVHPGRHAEQLEGVVGPTRAVIGQRVVAHGRVWSPPVDF